MAGSGRCGDGLDGDVLLRFACEVVAVGVIVVVGEAVTVGCRLAAGEDGNAIGGCTASVAVDIHLEDGRVGVTPLSRTGFGFGRAR